VEGGGCFVIVVITVVWRAAVMMIVKRNTLNDEALGRNKPSERLSCCSPGSLLCTPEHTLAIKLTVRAVVQLNRGCDACRD